MIYQNFNFTESFSNARGSRREAMVLSGLAKVIRTHPQAVKEALDESDVKVPYDVNKKGLAKLIFKNKNNQRMIDNLSSLVVLNAKYNEGHNFFGRNKEGGGDSGKEKGQFFKKVGTWFKDRKARRQGKKTERQAKRGEREGGQIGKLLNDNREEVANVGGSLLSGLFSRGGRGQVSQQILGNPPKPEDTNPNAKKPMSLSTKILIGVGILAVVGTAIYFIRKRKK